MANRNPWMFFMPRRRPESEWAPEDAYDKSIDQILEEPRVQEQILILAKEFDLQLEPGSDPEE